MYIGLGIVLIVIGAILEFVLQVDIPGMDDGMLGWILIAAGVLAIILTLVLQQQRRSTSHTSVVARRNIDGGGPPVV